MRSDNRINHILPRTSLDGIQNKQRNGQAHILQQTKSRQRRKTLQTIQIQDHDRRERRERKPAARCGKNNAYRPKNPILQHRRTASALKRPAGRHEHSRAEAPAPRLRAALQRRAKKKACRQTGHNRLGADTRQKRDDMGRKIQE